MESASAIGWPAQMRVRRFERELDRLRPLGEAYVLRRFGGSLGRADAEDAVSEVVIRLHRRMMDGTGPQNLRAAFFTSVRNAAIDLLRSRSVRPTVALEAAADAPTDRGIPAELAEDRDDAVRLQEALGRMRGNYREAIVLRFGLGMTVPEIASHLDISLPAAKKLVLRATRQIRKRLESIEDAEFCPDMRRLARQSLFEKHASGLASEAEGEVLRAHFAHCGSCRSFLASLHDGLHELGSGLLGIAMSGHLGGPAPVERLAGWFDAAHHGVRLGAMKVRHAAFKFSGVPQSGDGAASGALLGTGQKIVAVCTAGAAATATCVATGIVGPGIGPLTPHEPSHKSRPAHVKPAAAPVPASEAIAAPSTYSTPAGGAPAERTQPASHAQTAQNSQKSQLRRRTAKASRAAPPPEEFSFEGSAPASTAPSTATPSSSESSSSSTTTQASSPAVESGTSAGGGGGGSGGGSTGGGGGETFGFGG